MPTKLERVAKFEKTQAVDDGCIVEMAFASDLPYERWWGVEVLDCTTDAVRMERLNDGAPLLFNHDWFDLRGVHVKNSVRCDDDGVVRGKVRITDATQVGRDTIALVKSGVLEKSSVGYIIHKIVEVSKKKDGSELLIKHDARSFQRLLTRAAENTPGDRAAFLRSLDEARGEPVERASDDPPVFRVMDWEPYENSLVTVPADPSVGVGRSADGAPAKKPATPRADPAAATDTKTAGVHSAPWLRRRNQTASADHRSKDMPEANTASAGASADTKETRVVAGDQQQRPSAGTEFEKQRIRAIDNLCKANKIDSSVRDHWVGTGLGIDEISEDLLQILEQRTVNAKPDTHLGLSTRETREFSLFRAVQAAADKNWTNAGFELECTREIAKRLQKVADPNTFFVPYDVMTRPISVPVNRARRDLTVASGAGGGFLVETVNVGFIEMLRNRSVAFRMGARRLGGLQGNVSIPRQSAAGTAVWLANEASTITEGQQTFQQVALSPKNVGAYTEISRQLMLQSSPAAEGLVTADLAAVTALAVDTGVLNGSGGSGQPQGIIGTSGIGSVTGTSLAYAGILEFQTDVASANVMPVAGGYVTTPTVAALLMQRQRFSGTDTPLWAGNIWDGTVSGFAAMSSLQLPTANMLFGDWSQVIVGEWGVLQIDVNPYANFQAGIIGIRAITTMDVALRYAGAFSLATSIT